MITQERTTYRGIIYDPSIHEKASTQYVEHVYRGKRYMAPLCHDSKKANQTVELHYRGSVYKHRQQST